MEDEPFDKIIGLLNWEKKLSTFNAIHLPLFLEPFADVQIQQPTTFFDAEFLLLRRRNLRQLLATL